MSAEKSHELVDVTIIKLGEYVTDDYALLLEAPDNLLECYGSIKVLNPDKSISPSELIAILKNLDISDSIDLEKISIFCDEAAEGKNPDKVVLARGREPQTGPDGWFELIVKTGEEKPEPIEDDKGRVDFKAIQNFCNVDVDDLIGTIHQPQEGEPGLTISGKPIAAKPGNPATISAGNGVRIDEDGVRVYATESGRVVATSHMVSIAEEFVVSGDVDYKIGNITFNGFVEVKGDVLDDFNINATKGIKVSGAVGACKLNSEGPVSIGTMTGKGIGKISCKGVLQARYLNQVKVECWDDIIVSHEARNSVLKSTGKILLTTGQIAGGEAIALEGIEAKAMGARSGIKTHVTAGIYFPESDRLTYLRKQLKSSAEQLKRIGETLLSLNSRPLPKGRAALREAVELRIGILTQRQVKLEEDREQLSLELLNFKAGEHHTAQPKINVLSSLKEGVVIHLGDTNEEIKIERSGSVSIVEDTEQNGLRYMNHTPLTVWDEPPAPEFDLDLDSESQ